MNSKDIVPIVDAGRLPNYSKVFDMLDVAESTREDYKVRISLFLKFVKNGGFTRNTFLEFKRYLSQRQDYSVSTKNKYLITAKIFLRELSRQGVLPDTTQNVKVFSQSRKHKRDGLTEQEMAVLVESVGRMPQQDPQTARLKALLGLLIYQGLRQIEIARLDVADIDTVAKTAMIRGKGEDDREAIDLHPETCRLLSEYMKSNRISDGPLFASKSNNSRNRRLSTRAVRWIIKQVLKDAGIDKTTHGFRHHFVSKLIKEYRGDLITVQGYSRHRSLEMLTVYNDRVKKENDLPRFYSTFAGVGL